MFDINNDDDAFKMGEKLALIIANIALVIAMALTDYEWKTEIFNIVDPFFVAWFVVNILFLLYSATRSRFGRVSYTAISSNVHIPVTDQYAHDINIINEPPTAGESNVENPTIYDTYGIYSRGTSFPQLTNKRCILIAPKSLINVENWAVLFLTPLRRYCGIDQKSLPPDLTQELTRLDDRKFRYLFGGTLVWYGEAPDKWVAHHKPDGVVGPNGELYYWVVGGQASIPYSKAKEESYNRQIHDLRAQREELERQYERITGRPYVDDGGD